MLLPLSGKVPEWNDDTIPNFSSGIFTYELTVPDGTMNVPALMAIPEELNAQVSVKRAKVITGPLERPDYYLYCYS
jgi:hypothetical protein